MDAKTTKGAKHILIIYISNSGNKKQKLWHQLFIYILLIVSALMFLFGGFFNIIFKEMFTTYRIVIQELRIPLLGVVIAPIDEEIVKFLGYAFI